MSSGYFDSCSDGSSEDPTSVLKAWWQSYSKWPYPTLMFDYVLKTGDNEQLMVYTQEESS
ncbi:unnamed protein product [Brassica napus]|uniref:(rape) hypothetical protein n=1 Tax=Brassica napus TaxID=3708 RepID=A0A816J2D3_BRANA|nr:unnamed protein product [Brassica napus]